MVALRSAVFLNLNDVTTIAIENQPNSQERKPQKGLPRFNMRHEIQRISDVTGKEYDALFKSFLQCNMCMELVIKLHRTERPQIKKSQTHCEKYISE